MDQHREWIREQHALYLKKLGLDEVMAIHRADFDNTSEKV